MTAITLFNVDPNAQSGVNTTTPEIIFFNLLSAWVLREENQTIAGTKPDNEDGWFIMFWGVVAFYILFTVGVTLPEIYSNCVGPLRYHQRCIALQDIYSNFIGLLRQPCSANAQAGRNQEYSLTEETKEAGGNEEVGNTDLVPPVV